MTQSRLSIRDLRVGFGPDRAVDGLSLEIAAGECVALVGESGSGKSVTGRAILGLTGGSVSATRLSVDGISVPDLGPRALRRLRGGTVALIPQDALLGLDPLRPIGREISTTLQLHTGLDARGRAGRVRELLERVGMPDPAARAASRPGELSGGLRQRALIAAALAGDPALLIADEPTTALDARVRRGILELLGSLTADGRSVLLISHDLVAVRGIADRVAVMSAGRIVEQGPTERVLNAPEHPYTRSLLAASPAGRARGTLLLGETPAAPSPAPPRAAAATPILEASAVSRTFRRSGLRVEAVRAASLSLRAGSTLGLIGESGSGKSTLARILLGLDTPGGGQVRLDGQPWVPLPERERRARRHRIGAISQDPLGSFDPRLNVEQLLTEALSAGQTIRPRGHEGTLVAALDAVGLARSLRTRRPLTLSGGQRQRLAIARALAADPEILLCDEPVSALDLGVQAQVLDLLNEIQRERGLTMLFITHDLDVVRHMSDDLAVMYAGQIVETGPTERLFSAPRAEYTRALLAAGLGPAPSSFPGR
ncbi:ATP-binding cassette domain-containing protein [Mycetocola spongiae]|uniref:ATP-binding cassette domain-containing protein n=1 Tax=Mycetocola spongiae TaxID=2859226 RepID=UPI001CF29EE9|nr:ABC transporter ATP-binding protein [Mycetocola spongiae]UCR89336.1 ABC transporter ATP-binding protein [Mycetocola spongiae]